MSEIELISYRPGDQHKETAATTNPFLEQQPHVTDFTAQEIATLQSRLDKQLGPEYISTRPGAGGGKVHYLAAEKVINLANEVFGFNGWSSSIQNVQIDFVDESPLNGKITLGLSTIVRVTLRDGTFHEDIGYGHIENCKGKAAAFEKAKKEATTDAMKRALRNFGNVLGNCLYDKDYLSKVAKVKVAPARWDAENLHRHPDYAPVKKGYLVDAQQQQHHQEESTAARRQSSVQSSNSFGSAEFEDEFGSNVFDETDFHHPDEVHMNDTPARQAVTGPHNGGQQRQGVPRMHSMPQIRPSNVQAPPPVQNPQSLQRPQGPPKPPNNAAQAQANRMLPPQANGKQQRPGQSAAAPVQIHSDTSGPRSNPSSAGATTSPIANNHQQDQQRPPYVPTAFQGNVEEHDERDLPVPRMPPPGNPEGFVTGRNADLLNQPSGPRPPNAAALAFNPHAESPSIRRTHGVNPGVSKAITRQALNGVSAPNGQQASTAVVTSGHGGPPQQGQPQAPGHNGMNGTTTPIRTNFVNPSADMNRRIGMPSAASQTVQNRGGYRPPMKRPALTDVSNIQQMDGVGDAKKAKIDQQPDTPTPQGEVQHTALAHAVT